MYIEDFVQTRVMLPLSSILSTPNVRNIKAFYYLALVLAAFSAATPRLLGMSFLGMYNSTNYTHVCQYTRHSFRQTR